MLMWFNPVKSLQGHTSSDKILIRLLSLIFYLGCYFSWPDEARKAADVCFQHANIQGNSFGNCGITSSGGYIKCPVE